MALDRDKRNLEQRPCSGPLALQFMRVSVDILSAPECQAGSPVGIHIMSDTVETVLMRMGKVKTI